MDISSDVTQDIEPPEGVVKHIKNKEQQQQEQKRASFKQRMMGVKNSVCEMDLRNQTNRLELERLRQLRALQRQLNDAHYDYRVMQADQKRNSIEQRKRANPEADLSLEQSILSRSEMYLRFNRNDCCYLNKTNQYHLIRRAKNNVASSDVIKARKLLHQKTINRHLHEAKVKKEKQKLKTLNVNELIERPNSAEEGIRMPPTRKSTNEGGRQSGGRSRNNSILTTNINDSLIFQLAEDQNETDDRPSTAFLDHHVTRVDIRPSTTQCDGAPNNDLITAPFHLTKSKTWTANESMTSNLPDIQDGTTRSVKDSPKTTDKEIKSNTNNMNQNVQIDGLKTIEESGSNTKPEALPEIRKDAKMRLQEAGIIRRVKSKVKSSRPPRRTRHKKPLSSYTTDQIKKENQELTNKINRFLQDLDGDKRLHRAAQRNKYNEMDYFFTDSDLSDEEIETDRVTEINESATETGNPDKNEQTQTQSSNKAREKWHKAGYKVMLDLKLGKSEQHTSKRQNPVRPSEESSTYLPNIVYKNKRVPNERFVLERGSSTGLIVMGRMDSTERLGRRKSSIGLPTNCEERAKRHTTSYKLAKEVERLTSDVTTCQLLQLNDARQHIKENVINNPANDVTTQPEELTPIVRPGN